MLDILSGIHGLRQKHDRPDTGKTTRRPVFGYGYAARTSAGGKSVAEIFTETGETGFRQSEREVLAELTSEREAIVATGGGAPCFFDNMETMNRAGLTVYFKMSPEKLAGRLEHGKAKRPLLRDKSEEELIGFIRENVAKREKYYMQAKLIIDCDGVRDDYIAHHIAEYIETKKEQ